MITLRYIGKSADDLRFFILLDGMHAGGVTVHSIRDHSFSYGIAIAPGMRRKGAAKAGLRLLFEHMKTLGLTNAIVEIEPDNAASLALHTSLGFSEISRCSQYVRLTANL